MGSFLDIPISIFCTYFLYVLTSWNISISFNQTVNDAFSASELERKIWLGRSGFSLYSLIINKVLIVFGIAFICYFGFKSSFLSAVVLILIPILPVAIISRLLKSNFSLPIMAVVGVVTAPIFLAISALLTVRYF
ncbi:hypothetical protein [Acinetobacter modestus]|uniref:hypothetical protein n=1 Tax=Acinetobacter modestus TaxID=1776740 RepID=UPI001F4B680C|nr:hypothetical protein [Acinetobacter modestus]MCH7333486.1 hypothetical protein [Acinetobacter modestus]